MTSFLFPGQGSQFVGMGKDLYDHNPKSKSIFDGADEVLGFSLSKICFEGPDDELKLTANTQPAIFVHSMAALALLNEKPAMVAGHSLGEYSALVAAGAIEFEDALRLVRLRGELMHDCGIKQPGTMAAIVGLDDDVVDVVCAEARNEGIVQAANFNSPGQVVISGSVDGVHEAMRIAKERGARLVKELNVSGAFHSPLMQPAEEGLRAAIAATMFHNAEVPVYANVTAAPEQDANALKELLVHQLTKPVRWSGSIRKMAEAGADEFVEVGPGSVLQGLVKRIVPAAKLRSAGLWKDFPSA